MVEPVTKIDFQILIVMSVCVGNQQEGMMPNPSLPQCKVLYFSLTRQPHDHSLCLCILMKIMYDSSFQYKEFQFTQCYESCPMNAETPNSGHAAYDSYTHVMMYSMLSSHNSSYAPKYQLNSDCSIYNLILDLLINL